MAGDKVVITKLERALSEDINNLQSMSSRQLNDLLALLGAVNTISNSGASVDSAPQSWTLGLDIRPNGANITISSGVLSQQSTTHPAAVEPLESAQRLGINRQDTSEAVTGTPNAINLLECRVIDVPTLSEVRDIFNVPTQTFVPTNIVKQVERQIEFQITGASTTQIPAFSGDPWVPLFAFILDGAGEVSSFPTSDFWDMRNGLNELLANIPNRSQTNALVPDAMVSSWALHSRKRLTGTLSEYEVGGNFMARIGTHSTWLRSDQGLRPNDGTNVTTVQSTFEHLYLAPLTSNGVTVMPVHQRLTSSEGTTKGILLRSSTSPSASGPSNGSPLFFGLSTFYADFDSVPTHRAVHCGSAYLSPTGLDDGYVPFTQSSGGRYFLRADRSAGVPPATSKLLDVVSSALGGDTAFPFSFLNVVPANARTAIIEMNIEHDATSSDTFSWNFRRTGETISFGPNFARRTNPGNVTGVQWELPIHESTLDPTAKTWELFIHTVSGPAPTITIRLDCVGWNF